MTLKSVGDKEPEDFKPKDDDWITVSLIPATQPLAVHSSAFIRQARRPPQRRRGSP